MAEITPVIDKVVGDGSAIRVTWANMQAGDVGAPSMWLGWQDRSVQVFGTFGTGSVTIKGTNDGTNYSTLADAQGNSLTFSAAKIEQVLEVCYKVRPEVTGDGSTSVTVVMIASRSQSLRT